MNIADEVKNALMSQTYERTNDDVRLCVWLFLQKLNVIGIKRSQVTNMMTFLRATTTPIPKGAICLPIVSTSVHYLEVVHKQENQWK